MSSVMTSGTLRISMPFRLRSQHDIIRDMCNVVYEAGARHRWQDGDQPYQRGRWIFEDEGPDLIVMGYETAHVLTGCTREQWDAVMANAIDLDAEEEA